MLNFIKIVFIALTVERPGDLIQFVQYYFNLSFQEAMQKINQDFNLNLSSKTKLNYEQIKKIEEQKRQEKIKKQKIKNKYLNLCSQRLSLRNQILRLTQKINILNWEDIELEVSKLKDKMELLDIELNYLDSQI